MCQRNGICIGSCVAPVLSDIFLAQRNRHLSRRCGRSKIVAVFRYVDDYLVVSAVYLCHVLSHTFQTPCLRFPSAFSPDPRSPFQQLHKASGPLLFCTACLLGVQDRRKQTRPTLRHTLSWSNVQLSGLASVTPSRSHASEHHLESAFYKQVSRLMDSCYPCTLLHSVAEGMIRYQKKRALEANMVDPASRKKVAVNPYLHAISHNLNKMSNGQECKWSFSTGEVLQTRKNVNSSDIRNGGCTTSHQRRFVPYTENVVYSMPLPCGSGYIGQTGRCLM